MAKDKIKKEMDDDLQDELIESDSFESRVELMLAQILRELKILNLDKKLANKIK